MAKNDTLKCEFIVNDNNQCTYETIRPDNLKRHINEVHLKLKKACGKCGMKLTQSAFSRHSKRDCVQVKKNSTTTNSTAEMIEQIEIATIQEYAITTNVKIATLKDGSTMLIPSLTQMKIENCDVVLTTSSGNVSSSAINIPPDLPQIDQNLIENDVLLTPVDTPTDGN